MRFSELIFRGWRMIIFNRLLQNYVVFSQKHFLGIFQGIKIFMTLTAPIMVRHPGGRGQD